MKLKKMLSTTLAVLGLSAHGAQDAQEKSWQENYDARQRYFESAVGPLPADILKMINMTGVWPGGGLYAIKAPKLGPGMSVYTTFGFTNTDMPTTVRTSAFKLDTEGKRPTQAQFTLEKKQPAPKRPGAAGYGYELIVVAPTGLDWPVNLLQWAANAELGHDAGLLDRVEKYGGLTVEQIDVGAPEPLNILIATARAPLPLGTQLPAGKMAVLVATTITAEEMRWSMQNGREALLQRLLKAGVGQASRLGRDSVVR